jgi:hypothetical protein
MMVYVEMPLSEAKEVSLNFWTNGDGTDTYTLDLDNLSWKLYEPPVVMEKTPVATILSAIDLIQVEGGVTVGADYVIENALDGTTSPVLMQIEPDAEPGFTVVPVQAKCTVAQGITMYAPHDKTRNDPAQVKVYGKNSHHHAWSVLLDTLVALPQERNPANTLIENAPLWKTVEFPNTASYKYYKVTFPQQKQAGSTLQLGAVELKGFLCQDEGYVPAPPATPEVREAPVFELDSVVNVAYDKNATQTSTTAGAEASRAVDGNLNPFTSGTSVALSGAGATWQVDLGGEYDIQQVKIYKRMDDTSLKNIALEFSDATGSTVHVLPYRDAVPGDQAMLELDVSSDSIKAQFVAIHAWSWNTLNLAEVQVMAPVQPHFVEEEMAVANILSPNDIVSGWGRKSTESPVQAIGGLGVTWVTDLAVAGVEAVIIIVPTTSSCTVVKGLQVYTGENREESDPASFSVEGMNAAGEWQIIVEGLLNLPQQRNAADQAMDPLTAFHDAVSFSNLEAYAQYRVSFPTNKGGSTVEVGEIQLSGVLCTSADFEHAPTPSPTASPTANADSACTDLISSNGDAETSPFLTAPFEQTYSTAPMPQIMSAGGNQWFRVGSRTRWVDGMAVYVEPDCIVTDWPYHISFKYKLITGGAGPFSARVRVDYLAISTGEWVNSVADLVCENGSKGQWVDCDMVAVLAGMDPSLASIVRVNFWTDGAGTEGYTLDMDNISFQLYEPPMVTEVIPVSNLLAPNDLITVVGGSTLGANTVDMAIDGTSTKMNILISTEQGSFPGLEVTPLKACTVAQGVRLYAANDRYGSDPAQVVVLGRNAPTEDWNVLVDSLLAIPMDRNTEGRAITTSGMLSRFVDFPENETPYKYYQVLFPQIKKLGDTTLHIAEVELAGKLCPSGYVPVPSTPKEEREVPYFELGGVINVAYGKAASQTSTTAGMAASRAVDGNLNPFTSGLSVALTGTGGATWQVDLGQEYEIGAVKIYKRMDSCCRHFLENFAVEFLDATGESVHVVQYRDNVPNDQEMVEVNVTQEKVRAQYVALHAWSGNSFMLSEVQVFAPLPEPHFVSAPTMVDNILSPGDIVTGWGRKNYESPQQTIDATGKKLTVDLAALALGFPSPSNGFVNGAVMELVPAQSSCTTVKGIRVFPADRDESTDPTSYLLEGMDRLTGEWALISQGPLNLPADRNPLAGASLTSFQEAPLNSNQESYYQYRLSFPTNNGGSWTQVGEVQLQGELCEFEIAAPRAITTEPTAAPTSSPTKSPTQNPTKAPTASPTKRPTAVPTKSPTKGPTASPMAAASAVPSKSPTQPPTKIPTKTPTLRPSKSPTESPTSSPTKSPTAGPTGSPTKAPTASPTKKPTYSPTKTPTALPTVLAVAATNAPTPLPTTKTPTASPTAMPIHSECFDLIESNNDAQDSTTFIAPFRPTSNRATVTVAVEEMAGNNHYFSITGRQRRADGIFVLVNAECVRNDVPYIARFRYRMHSPDNHAYAARVRVDARGKNGDWTVGLVDEACPHASSGGSEWVTCEIQRFLDLDPAAITHVRIFFWGDFGANSPDLDLDDIHFDLSVEAKVATNVPFHDLVTGSGYVDVSEGTRLVTPDGDFTSALRSVHDGTTNDVMVVQGLNGEAPGFIVDPMNVHCIVVNGMTLYTSSGVYERDPAAFELYGQNDADQEAEGLWNPIASGLVALDTDRNAEKLAISSDLAHKHFEFPNTVSYQRYKVLFPESKVARGEVQLAELQLSGFVCPDADYTPIAAAEEDASLAPGTYHVENVALHKPAWQSATLQRADASRAVDGNTDGVYGNKSTILTNAYNGPMWKVDLGQEYPIEEVIVWNRSDCCEFRLANYAVEFLDENNYPVHMIWNKGMVDTSTQDSHYSVSQNNVKARYVALHNWSGNVIHVAEVEVMAQVPNAV